MEFLVLLGIVRNVYFCNTRADGSGVVSGEV